MYLDIYTLDLIIMQENIKKHNVLVEAHHKYMI